MSIDRSTGRRRRSAKSFAKRREIVKSRKWSAKAILTAFLSGALVLPLAYLAYILFYDGDQTERDRCEAMIKRYGIEFNCDKVRD